MIKLFKKILLVFFVFLSLIILYFPIQYLLHMGNKNDVQAICKSQVGKDIADVFNDAKKLNFSEEKQGALGYGISFFTEERAIQWSKDEFVKVSSGTLSFGKVIFPPFLRHYCHVEFKNRKVTKTKVVIVD